MASKNKMATSEKDQAVLESIFNPLLPLGDIPPKHKTDNENEINVENTEDSKRAKELETSGVEKAEQGDFEGALECFNEACEICPSRPSCFNNRAQLWRLKGNSIEVALAYQLHYKPIWQHLTKKLKQLAYSEKKIRTLSPQTVKRKF